MIDFALQLHKCNHLFSTRENGTLESPYLPAGNSVTSPNHHQFLNEMDSTPVKQTNSFSRNTKGKILVCSLNCGFPKKPFIMNAPMCELNISSSLFDGCNTANPPKSDD